MFEHTASPLILGAKMLQRKYISFLFKKRKTKRSKKERIKKVLSFFVINMPPIVLFDQ